MATLTRTSTSRHDRLASICAQTIRVTGKEDPVPGQAMALRRKKFSWWLRYGIEYDAAGRIDPSAANGGVA